VALLTCNREVAIATDSARDRDCCKGPDVLELRDATSELLERRQLRQRAQVPADSSLVPRLVMSGRTYAAIAAIMNTTSNSTPASNHCSSDSDKVIFSEF
jgi:hypothetical protein